MRWQSVVGAFMGFFLGKYLSMAIFWIPGILIAGRNISGGGSGVLSLAAFMTLLLVCAVSTAIWLFVNFFAISSWFPKGAIASSLISAAMILYTTLEVLFCGILNWFVDSCRVPFWIGGWFF